MHDKEEKKVEEEAEVLGELEGQIKEIGADALKDILGAGGLDFGSMMGFVKEFFEDFEERQIKMNNMLVNLRKGQETLQENQQEIIRWIGKRYQPVEK